VWSEIGHNSPLVVTVTIAHHRASPPVSVFAVGGPKSKSGDTRRSNSQLDVRNACTAGARLELLDHMPMALRRPLTLVGMPAYTATCLHIRATITKWLDKHGDVA
jgi:hypothetical protein